jgi:uncharacterized protein YigE (DUF2233 family)
MGCLLKLLVLALLAGVIVFVAADSVFNLKSNIPYLAFRDTASALSVQVAGKWKPLGEVTQQEMDHALAKEADHGGASWRVLRFRRKAQGLFQAAAQGLFDMEVNVLEFAPGRFQLATSFREGFVLTTARERLESGGLTFAVTANFRDPKDRPLGLVVHEGVQRNPPFPNWSGYFFVKDGRPWFGPKSLFEETPGLLSEASQGYPSLMRDHNVFSYVDLQPNKFFDGNKITYRALAGVKQTGAVIFILSGDGGVMNVSEVAAIAQKLNVQHTTLLDGGRALQYSLEIGGRRFDFAAYNTTRRTGIRSLERQRSPVFIAVKSVAAPAEETAPGSGKPAP